MADHHDANDRVDNIIFVYTGGRVPQHLKEIITHARIDESVRVIDDRAFEGCPRLLDVDFHDGVDRVGRYAFSKSPSLPGVKIIDKWAFSDCVQLTDVEFGDKMETIGDIAFKNCSLRNINIPSIRTIGAYAFCLCTSLTDAEFGDELETIGLCAFLCCSSLRRIAIPLKVNLLSFDEEFQNYTQFHECKELATVDFVWGGEIHNIVSHLSLKSWRNEMNQEINRINQILPTIVYSDSDSDEKAGVIQEWIQSVLRRIEHYKSEHHNLLKEATTLLELALWKAKLSQKKEEEDSLNNTEVKAKRAKIDVESARQEMRVTCGADIIIKNVLPFLKLPST